MFETASRESNAAVISNNPISILHVDGDDAFLSMAKRCLEMQANFEVESALSVQEALEILKTRKFDVIVSDYQMNGKDGLEFLEEIKAAGITTPFILFSGKGRDEVAVKALNSGAFRYIDKRGALDATYAELASCILQATHYSRAQAMLKDRERRFRAIFDSSIDAILVLNDNGEIVYNNKAAKNMMDYAKDQIAKALNQHFNKQFASTYEQNMNDGFKQLSDGNLLMTGKTVELTLKDNLGKTTVVELSFSAFIESGQWFGVSIVRDVSERKRQEKLLEKSQQTLKALFAYNPEAIVFTDKNFRVTDVNRSFIDLFGFTIESIKGKKLTDFIVPAEFKKESKTIEKLIAKGQVTFSAKRKRRDGTIIDVSLSGGPLVVKGKIVGFFMSYLDISNLIIVQNVLASALSKAELLNEKITVLGGFTRHDVRNKLGLIQGNLYLARKKCKADSNLEKYLGNIDASIKNICDIFDFAKTYEMIGVEELVPVDIGQMVQNALYLFSDLKGVKVQNHCIGFEVIADSLLTQVFYNLIDNSLKYGEKISTISIFAQKIGENSVKLCFRDDGVGIDKKFKDRLFERGFGKGTGFGLYLIHKICEVYNWKVKETGQLGQGAQFEFIIPVEKVKRFVESR